jgi:hypothetical protein
MTCTPSRCCTKARQQPRWSSSRRGAYSPSTRRCPRLVRRHHRPAAPPPLPTPNRCETTPTLAGHPRNQRPAGPVTRLLDRRRVVGALAPLSRRGSAPGRCETAKGRRATRSGRRPGTGVASPVPSDRPTTLTKATDGAKDLVERPRPMGRRPVVTRASGA